LYRFAARAILVASLSRAQWMLGRFAVFLGAAVAGMIASGPAEAWRWRHQINATPFFHSPCSVLRGRPCTPSFCSVLSHGPCIPEIEYPYGENLQLTVETVPSEGDKPKYVRPDHGLDSIADLFAELRSCWSPPPVDAARPGMQMTVRFSFRRDGGIIAAPRLTFATAGISAEIRDIYLKAISTSLDTCVPLKFTGSLAGALAGRPIAIRYVDNREPEQHSGKP
jgi:hypothetical protein